MKHWYEYYNKFFDVFKKNGTSIDETAFYFKDDINEVEHYIGFLPKYDKPYWAGYCDVPDGCSFKTAEKLFEAKIYDGKSIKDRWDEIVFIQISGIDINEWAKVFGVNVD